MLFPTISIFSSQKYSVDDIIYLYNTAYSSISQHNLHSFLSGQIIVKCQISIKFHQLYKPTIQWRCINNRKVKSITNYVHHNLGEDSFIYPIYVLFSGISAQVRGPRKRSNENTCASFLISLLQSPAALAIKTFPRFSATIP